MLVNSVQYNSFTSASVIDIIGIPSIIKSVNKLDSSTRKTSVQFSYIRSTPKIQKSPDSIVGKLKFLEHISSAHKRLIFLQASRLSYISAT